MNVSACYPKFHLESALLSFLKHVNTDTVAIVMLVAVALLSKPVNKPNATASSYENYKDSLSYRYLQTLPQCGGQSYR